MTPHTTFSLVTAVAAIASTGCAGTNFSEADTARIRNGMTESEVVEILGKPYSRTQVNGQTAVLTWSYSAAFGGAKAASYRFVDGKVAGSTKIGQ